LETQSVEWYLLAGQCRVWMESKRFMPSTGVEFVFGVLEKAKADQAETLATQAIFREDRGSQTAIGSGPEQRAASNCFKESPIRKTSASYG